MEDSRKIAALCAKAVISEHFKKLKHALAGIKTLKFLSWKCKSIIFHNVLKPTQRSSLIIQPAEIKEITSVMAFGSVILISVDLYDFISLFPNV